MANGMEIGFFTLKDGVSEEEMLVARREMERAFLSKEEDLLSHNVVRLEQNLYADVAIGKSRDSVERICGKWLEEPSALAFLELIEAQQIGDLQVLNFGDVL